MLVPFRGIWKSGHVLKKWKMETRKYDRFTANLLFIDISLVVIDIIYYV